MGDKKIFIFVSLICLIGLASAWADNSSSYQEVDGCNLLNTTGATYVLTDNVSSTGTCFIVNAQNITLDCNGSWITYSIGGAGSTYGIYTNQFNTTIKNCNILDGNWTSSQTTRRGIYFNGNDNSTLFNNFVNTSNSYAVYLYNGANYNNLTYITASSNTSHGINLDSSSNYNTLFGITVNSNSSHGIYLSSVLRNSLINIIATSKTGEGIYLHSSSINSLNNITAASNTSNGIYMYSSGSNNLNNITVISETGNGIKFYGVSSSNNVLSNINASSNSGSSINFQFCNKNTLSNVTAISNTGYGMNIYDSAADLTNVTSISLNGAEDLYYSGTTRSKCNCIFTNVTGKEEKPISFVNGNYKNINNIEGSAIFLCDANFSNITNSSFTRGGIRISWGNKNIFSNIIATSNSTYGIYMYSVSNNTFSNITASSNSSNGVYMYLGLNNTLSNITVISNISTVFSLPSSSDSNLIVNSTLISLNKNATLLYVGSNCNNNVVYWNNFTDTEGYYVQDVGSSNYYNFTINGNGEGNIWYNILTNSVNVAGTVNSIAYPGLYLGKSGTGYPYTNISSLGKIIGDVTDYAPLTSLFSEDASPPTYNLASHNSTETNQIVKFSLIIYDNLALHPNGQYIFSTNNNGTWVNDTAVNFTSNPSWANVTKTLNSSEEINVGYRWYLSDNHGNTNSTEIYELTTFPPFSCLGEGTLENPYNITNCIQLQQIRENLSAYYQLVNDIDCSNTINWNGGEGFEPVGKNYTAGFYFNGNFNGNNFSITNLFINRSSSDYVGLFGYIIYGNVSNIGLVNVNITGKDFVGGISGGLNYGNMINSYSTGNVNGNNYTGGLIGDSFGFDSSINNSYSKGYVTGNGNYVGGLIGSKGWGRVFNSYSNVQVTGLNYVGGLIGYHQDMVVKGSYATGDVRGIGENYVGGLIGHVDYAGFYYPYVIESYSTGNVNGTYYVGGLVGYNRGTINNSYSTGEITGEMNIYMGGIAGYLEGYIFNSYWYNHSQGLDCYSGENQNCTAISDLNYFYNYENSPTNLTAGNGWDFASVWDDLLNGTSYPVLQWQGAVLVYPNITFVSPTTATGENIQTFITANVSVENATSVVNLTVFLYNSSSGNLIVQNSTTSNNLFWNITGLSVGNYSLNASVEDNDGLINQTETLSINLTVFLDTFSPTYSSVAHSSTYAGHVASFSININDETALHPNGQYIFSTNNSGTWENDTAVNFTSTPSWANVSKTLNSNVGMVVGYMWYLNDDNGNVNSTSVYKLTTTQAPVVDPPSSGGGGSTAQVQTQYQLGREFSEYGESLKLRKNYQVGFRHQEESHTLTVNSFTTNTAKITIRSDPITATLEKDIAQSFNIDDEEGTDVEITYQGTSGSEAQFFIKKIIEVTGESEVFANSEGGEVQETNQISTDELFGTSGSGSESVDVAKEKTKRAKNPLRTVLISLIIMGAVIAGLYAIGKNEKKKKDHYLGFFDK